MSRRVFMSGCGGGYDIFGGVPLYFKMKSNGIHDITLINYSFTSYILLSKYGQQLTTLLFRVDPTLNVAWLTEDIYFPEQRLANELQVPVYAIRCDDDETRIELIIEAYRYLIEGRPVDELILVECGADVLLIGNELELGTPEADISHARAIQLLSSTEVKTKYVLVIGANIEAGHHVLQQDIDARIHALTPYTISTWLWNSEHDVDVRRYVETFFHCHPRDSIFHSLLCAALEGRRGYYLPEHLYDRIEKSVIDLNEELCISTLYYFDDVMKDNVYIKRLTPHMNLNQIHDVIYGTIGHEAHSGFIEHPQI